MARYRTYKNSIYTGAIVGALILHVFNTFEISGIKVFQYSACIALIGSCLKQYPVGKINIISFILITSTWFSALYSPFPDAISKALTFSIIIGSCIPLYCVQYNKIIWLANFLIPIPLLALFLLSIIDIQYRFVGFYVDPNYLCTTLLVFLYLIIEGFFLIKNWLAKLILILETIILVYITVSTLSRTGLACVCLLLVFNLLKIVKNSKFLVLLIILLVSLYSFNNTSQLIEESIKKIESREENKDDFSSASHLRLMISMNGVAYILEHPQYLLFGMGPGAVGHWTYFDTSINDDHIDHNTLTAFFSEWGLIGFVLYLSIWLVSLRRIRSLPYNYPRKHNRLYMLILIFIFSLSINQCTYLPFWWILFLLNNKTQIDEYTTYS